MKSTLITFRNLRLHLSLSLGLCLANVVWGAPSIQSIEVSPNPLTNGQRFSIAVTASPDVTHALAAVDFRPGQPRLLQIPLTKQGLIWTGSGVVPTELRRQLPHEAGAMVKVVLFDAAGLRAVGVAQVGVEIVSLSAVFTDGILTVTGDDHDNAIIVGRDAAGRILVNDGAVPVLGGVATVANTSLIRFFGLRGNDELSLNESNGALPAAELIGGDGDDLLIGGSDDDTFDGGPGNDILLGKGGSDQLFGGAGDDSLTGGTGVDQFFGGDGDDRIIWNPGEGSDVVEGEGGQDTMEFFGGNGTETVDISAVGQRLRFFRNPANITMDCDGIEEVIFRAAAGADAVTVNDLTGTQVKHIGIDLFSNVTNQTNIVVINGTDADDHITVTASTNGVDVAGLTAAVTIGGGEQDLDELVINAIGSDDRIDASAVEAGAMDLTLNGGAGNDELLGGGGNDLLIGVQGADVGFGGAGDDMFVWNPGDGSDVFEGQAGQDTMLFNGANVGETVDLSANGQRLRFFRNPVNITMDCNEVEVIQFNALGGADAVTVGDLSGTGVAEVNLNLAFAVDSDLGDNLPDTVTVNGTSSDDVATITGTPAGVSVIGLPATVNLVGSDPALDQLIIRLLAGNDAVEASGLENGVINLTADGGVGDDVLIGSSGPDTLLGGEGDDVLEGGPGLDVLDGGPGGNVVIQD